MENGFESYCRKWLREKKGSIKESSLARYSLIIQNHLIPYWGDLDIGKIDSNDVKNFVDYLLVDGNKRTGKGLGSYTVSGIVQLLVSIIHCYREEYELPYKPIRVQVSATKENGIPLSPDDATVLKNYLFIHSNDMKNVGLALCLMLGLRAGEVCGLKWSNVDFNNKVLNIENIVSRVYEKDPVTGKGSSRVLEGDPKTKNSRRSIPLTRTVYDLLIISRHKVDSDCYIITSNKKPAEPIALWSYFKRLINKLGMNDDYTVHSLRHSFGTNCVASGMDYKSISKLMGHSSTIVTLDLYVHPQIGTMREQLEAMEKRL